MVSGFFSRSLNVQRCLLEVCEGQDPTSTQRGIQADVVRRKSAGSQDYLQDRQSENEVSALGRWNRTSIAPLARTGFFGSTGRVGVMAILLGAVCVGPAFVQALGVDLSSSIVVWPPTAGFDAESIQVALNETILVTHLQSMLGWITSFAGIGFFALASAQLIVLVNYVKKF